MANPIRSILNRLTSLEGGELAEDVPAEDWHIVGEEGEPDFGAGWSRFPDGLEPSFYKDKAGMVHIRGSYAFSGVGGFVLFTLPEGYRPDITDDAGVRLAFAIALWDSSANKYVSGSVPLVVNFNGDVTIDDGYDVTVGVDDTLELGEVTFRSA